MEKIKLDRLLTRFSIAAQAHNQALEDLDEEEANGHARMIALLYAAIVKEGSEGREALLGLVDGPNHVVAGMAAVYSIHYNSEKALAVLRVIAKEPGLLGFRASVALERWEAGELNADKED